MRKFVNKLIIFILIFTFINFLSSCKKSGSEIDKDSIDDKYKFEAVVSLGQIISGEEDIHNFYLLTNESNIKAMITVSTIYESSSYKHILIYNGSTYDYYELNDEEKELIGNYKYLNYSKTTSGIDSSHTYLIGYLLTNAKDYTAGEYFNDMLKSYMINDKIFQSRLLLVYYENSDLYFRENKIISPIEHLKDGIITKYYSTNANSGIKPLITIVRIINTVQWSKDAPVTHEVYDHSNEVRVSLQRTLVNDTNNLMVKHDSDNNQYELYYVFNLDYKYVSMVDTQVSSAEILYATLTDEQVEQINSILNDDLIEDFSLGTYHCSVFKDLDSIGTDLNPVAVYVNLLEGNIAKISVSYTSSYVIRLPFLKLVFEGSYEIIEDESGDKELVISDNEYIYKFKLSEGTNKGICFISEGSIVDEEFREVADASFFAYYTRPIVNEDTISISSLGSYADLISNEMKVYTSKFSKYIYGNLWRICPNDIQGLVGIYKFDKECASFLEYNKKIYPIGDYLKGYGLTEMAYYHSGYTNLMYFICTSENEDKKSIILAFDFNDEKMKKVDLPFNENNNIDISFDRSISGDGKVQLSVYESELKKRDDSLYYERTQIKLLEENILDYELIPIE